MESGVENVVLGDIQRVLSIARNKHGYLLNERTASLERIFQAFALLRSRLFRTENVLDMDPTTLLQPFLDLIRHERTSSQLTRAALEGVENFLQNWELAMASMWTGSSSTSTLFTASCMSMPSNPSGLHGGPPAMDPLAHQTLSDTVSEVVDAVVQCRFQETDQDSDRRVILMVVQVLKAIVTTRWVTFLSDHSMWQLVESLYGLSRSSLRESYMTNTLRSASTNVLRQTLRVIFQKDAIYDPHGVSLGFGLPCAVKIVGFLCQKLHHPQFQPKLASMTTTAASNGSPLGVFSRRDVYLSFKLLLVVLSTSKQRLAQVPSLMIFIKDDVCSAILRYSRLGVTADHSILLVCLQMIRLLWCHCRLLLKMQLEAILSTVFVQTLHWILSHLEMYKPGSSGAGNAGGGSSLSSSGGGTSSSSSSSSSSTPTATKSSLLSNGSSFVTGADDMETIDEFTGQVVQLDKLFVASQEILECLVDLVAQPTFVPDLYVNYDCDGNRCDLMHTICKLLVNVVVKSHGSTESPDANQVHWAQGMGETALRALFNALYVLYHRTQRNSSTLLSADSTATTPAPATTPSVTPPTSTAATAAAWNLKRIVRNPSSSELAIDFNGAMVGFETAEQLFLKRQRKKKFQFGIQEFNRKPLAGIKYLQSHGFLPTSLDPASLASFLRSLPSGLSKKAVGVYLGAVGKEVQPFEKKDVHEADTMQFHREVLAQFVGSFNFEERGVLEALRIFLASFRLPGEAQQIDRILNQFATQVYAQSRDRVLFASVDVAYILCFALIMLNTDLHNANIRPDKKMKLEDFIKNNCFYGEDVCGTMRLPESFLEELYTSIAHEQIQTLEDATPGTSLSSGGATGGGANGAGGAGAGGAEGGADHLAAAAIVGVTMDRWKDLLYQAERNPNESLFIVHQDLVMSHSTPSSNRSSTGRHFASPSVGKETNAIETDGDLEEEDDEDVEMESLRNKLGCQYDQLIFEVLYDHLMMAFGSVFEQFVMAHATHGATNGTNSSSTSRSSVMTYLPDKVMLQLACNGFVLTAAVASHLELVEMFNQVFVTICDYTSLVPSNKYPVGCVAHAKAGGEDAEEAAVEQFCANTSAPLATAAMLKLVNTCAHSLKRAGWRPFLRCLSVLREFRALPLTLNHAQKPLLNGQERRHFEDLIHQEIEAFEYAKAQAEAERKARNPPTNEGGSNAFFSGVAWLMNALDQSLGSSTSAAEKKQKKRLRDEAEEADAAGAEQPVDLAYDVHDLMDFVESTGDFAAGSSHVRKRLSSSTANGVLRSNGTGELAFGTSEWIARTLEPYRLESFLMETSKLPFGTLEELLLALDEEISSSLTRASVQDSGVTSTATGKVTNHSHQVGQEEEQQHEEDEANKTNAALPSPLSPGGTIFCAHLLSQIVYLNLVSMVSSSSAMAIAASSSRAATTSAPHHGLPPPHTPPNTLHEVFQATPARQVVSFLQRHLSTMFGALRPLLEFHDEIHGMNYQLGANLLDKTLLCMFSALQQLVYLHHVPLALKPMESEQFMLNCLKYLMEMKSNVLEMVLTQVVAGLDRILDCNMQIINANEQWMTFLYLVELSVQDAFASHYGFAIVKKIVTWRLEEAMTTTTTCTSRDRDRSCRRGSSKTANGMTLPSKTLLPPSGAQISCSPIKQLDLFTICLRFALQKDFVHREEAMQLLETICCELDDDKDVKDVKDDNLDKVDEPFKTHLRMAGGFMLRCLHQHEGEDQLKGIQVLESMLHHMALRKATPKEEDEEEEEKKKATHAPQPKLPMGWPFWMEVLRFGLIRIAAQLFAHFDFALEKKYAFVLPTKEQKAQVALFYYETNDFETFFAQQQRERSGTINRLESLDDQTAAAAAAATTATRTTTTTATTTTTTTLDPQHPATASLHDQQQQPQNPKRSPLSRLQRAGSALAGAVNDMSERRTRRTSWRDPPELRSLLIVLQLMSWVVCEQFHALLASPAVFELWHSIVEVFVGALQSTNQLSKDDSISNVALERRAILAAHEDILEHFKSICRRVWKQQELPVGNRGENGEIPQQMIQILKQSIDSKRDTPSHDGELLYELFPSFAPDASLMNDEAMAPADEVEPQVQDKPVPVAQMVPEPGMSVPVSVPPPSPLVPSPDDGQDLETERN